MTDSDSTYDPTEKDGDIAEDNFSDFDSDVTYDPNEPDVIPESVLVDKISHSEIKPIMATEKPKVDRHSSKIHDISDDSDCETLQLNTSKSGRKMHDISDESDCGTVELKISKNGSKSLFSDTDSENEFDIHLKNPESRTSQKRKTDGETKKCSDEKEKSEKRNIHSDKKKVHTHLRKTDTLPIDRVERVNLKMSRSPLPPCRYGSKCYRKNPSHFEAFYHPSTTDLKRKHSSDTDETCLEAKKIKVTDSNQSSASTSAMTPKSFKNETKLKKPNHHEYLSDKELVGVEILKHAEPYSFFLTKVSGIQPKHNHSLAVSLKDILHPTMGKLVKSAQFNYMFEIPWIMQQYPPEFRKCPLLLVHGFTRGDKAALDMEATVFDNIRLCQARLDIMYGTHHTKMMLLQYDTGMRVVISTANLIERDWFQKTQGLWISPKFPKMATPGLDGDSTTCFKRDLIQYLSAYKARQLSEWIDIIKQHDMSQAKVHLIGSTPGRHIGEFKQAFGHLKLRKVLERHGPEPSKIKGWPVIGQFSSIGSLGPSEDNWLCGEFYTSLSSAKGGGTSIGGNINKLKLIYPSSDNVRISLEGYPAGGSLPYSNNTAKKQPYLNKFLHQWCSRIRGRSRAAPHIKTYCRLSPEQDQMAWFLVTSANLSKAAWGALEKKGSQLMIRSYEIGVLFFPDNYDNSCEYFPVLQPADKMKADILPPFPQPYDFPLKPYTKTDQPWIVDLPYTDLPDSHGNAWCPS